MMILPLLLALSGVGFSAEEPAQSPTRTKPKPKPVDLMNLAEGRRIILTLVPEGTLVTKGQVVGELDSVGLRNTLANQQIATKLAEGQYEVAKTHRESMEKIYGMLPEQLARETKRVNNYVELRSAMDSDVDRRVRELEVWEVSVYGVFLAKHAATKTKTATNEALKAAKLSEKTLETVTKPNRTKEAEILYDHAKSDELAKFSVLAMERAKEKKLRLQIERCKLLAPADGMLIYANPDDGRVFVEEGATVRERQVLVRIQPY